MIEILFGFGGRVTRLQFLLSCIAVAAAGLLAGELAFGGLGPADGRDSGAPHFILSIAPLLLLFLCAASLQARRFRDMGWDPLYVIPGWIAINAIDRLVALQHPNLAMSGGFHQTLLGLIANGLLWAALLLWPSQRETPGLEPAIGAKQTI